MGPKLHAEPIVTALVVGAAILMISSVRGKLFSAEKQIRNAHDVYFLPPPKKVRAMSLGYTHATADLLWAHVLVSQGLHTFERRRFDNLNRLYDTVNELDPTWRTPYIMADALITFQQSTIPMEDVLKARQIMERGAEHRPHDAQIWLNLGQFVSFIAPASYIEDHDPELANQWRADGIVYLQRAAELAAGDPGISWQALGGAVILDRELGQHAASIRYYERVYAVTEDPDLRREIEQKLERHRLILDKKEDEVAVRRATQAQLDSFDRLKERRERFDAISSHELPMVSGDVALMLGPPPHPAACAGPGHEAEPRCAASWKSWATRFDADKVVREREAPTHP